MLEGNEEARRGRRLEAQVGHKMPQTQKKKEPKRTMSMERGSCGNPFE